MQILFLLTIVSCCQQDLQATDQDRLPTVVIESFESFHDGYSSDEVILSDKLNAKFIAACLQQLPDTAVAKFNWTLINLRKAGKLSTIKTTSRNRKSTENVILLAEIVTRSVLDREKISIDRIMADPKTRKQFDDLALSYDKDVDLYLVRKAAFQLRKTRRLRPELITRIADWGRVVKKFSVQEFSADNSIAPERPGIYIFHDESGYLYIGHSDNLNKRLKTHLDESSNIALAKYLAGNELPEIFVEIHAFPEDSRAKEITIRRAYESELIRSRKPRFNILP